MIKSMTGYGRGICKLSDKTITTEIKSLNSKQTDIYTRMPNIYKEKDLDIRNEISAKLQRGKIECIISIEYEKEDQAARINTEVVKAYFDQLKEISTRLDLPVNESLLPSILRLPESFSTEKDEFNEEEWQEILDQIKSVLDEVNDFRSQEGNALEKDIRSRIKNIETCLIEIQPYEQTRIENIRKKINDSILELKNSENIDQNRFEQELIYYLERLDITEEKVRLDNHCKYFLEVMDEPGPVGKKLAFVSQEIGREINTIGSKANNSDIQHLVIKMKDELEKIKEQVMNIL